MMKKVRKLIITFLVVLSIGGGFSSTKANAAATMTEEDLALINITEIVSKENISESDIARLETELAKLGIDDTSIFTLENYESIILSRGFNQKHSLGKGWTMEVHRPHGSDATQYHTHVKGKVGNKTVEAKEALNGDSTHGKGNTMNDKKVPKDIQKKVKEHKDFKKAKEEESKAKKAKKEITAKKLNLKKAADLVIAIGIFIAVVGVVLLAVTSTGGWAAILLAI